MPNKNRIQQHIDENIADIPLFFGDPKLDTVKASTYIDRIDQGITLLDWTTEDAFSYFLNSVSGNAEEWLKSYLFNFKDTAVTYVP